MSIFDRHNKPIESETDKKEREAAAQAAQLEKAKRNKKYKRRFYLSVVGILIAAVVYGTTRPGVVTYIRTTVRYFSGTVQTKAWNEAKREVLEAEIKGRQTELEQVKPQSFWTPEIVKEAHAQIIEQTTPDEQETIPASVGPETQPSKSRDTTIPKSNAKSAAAGVPGNYAKFAEMAQAAGLSTAQTALLKRIGECESGFQMKPNSSGTSSAYGIFQELKVHDKRAKALGGTRFDLETHIAVGIALFKEQGTAPWVASKHCWNKK